MVFLQFLNLNLLLKGGISGLQSISYKSQTPKGPVVQWIV